jgi:hypothetical protein
MMKNASAAATGSTGPARDDSPPLADAEQKVESGPGAARPFSLTADPRLRLFALGINLLVLVELCVAMFFAAQEPDSLTPVFFKLFFGMLAPTIITAVIGRRLIGKRLAAKGS